MNWTAEDVREAIRVLTADDHASGRHDLRVLPNGVCDECDRYRGGPGHYEVRMVNVCSRPEAATFVSRRVWVRDVP